MNHNGEYMNISVVISVTESVLQHAIAEALANHRSLEEQICAALMSNSQTSVAESAAAKQDWLATALARTRAKSPGDEFMLEDLFTDDEWNSIPTHSVFGREFKKALEKNQPQEARFDRKTATNKAVYLRL
jgi:hypothetical protein